MAKLTASQVANRIGKTSYTIKRWYQFIEETPMEELIKLQQKGMPILPKYELIGTRGDRIWNEEDIPALIAFSEWIPHTKNGIFKKYKKVMEEN